MTTRDLQQGEIVAFTYKSGAYIGSIYELRPNRAVVEVLAVLEHPKQGDLHQRNQADVAMFHQRKALSHREKALVPYPFVKRHEGAVPDYTESLRMAVDLEIGRLQQMEPDTDVYAQRAIELLLDLKTDYLGSPS